MWSFDFVSNFVGSLRGCFGQFQDSQLFLIPINVNMDPWSLIVIRGGNKPRWA